MPKITTDTVRLSYANIWQPRKKEDPTDKDKYGVVLMWPEENTTFTKKVEDAIAAAHKEGTAGLWQGKHVSKDKHTLYHGSEKPDNEAAQGQMCLSTSSGSKPGIYRYMGKDQKNEPIFDEITDREAVYNGCYCRASVNISPYDHSGKKGVTAYINHLIFVKHGERLGGGRDSVANDFAGVDLDEFGDYDDDDV
jgi:hypothetical protein